MTSAQTPKKKGESGIGIRPEKRRLAVTEEPIRPATDEEIAVIRPLGYMCIGCDPKTPPETHGSACIFAMEPKLLARIEADAATIRERDLQAINAEVRINGYKAAAAIMEDQNAAQVEEIERITERAVQVHLELEHKHAAESAELRARCERYEGLIVRFHESHFAGADEWPRDLADEIRAEARAIRARREAGKQ